MNQKTKSILMQWKKEIIFMEPNVNVIVVERLQISIQNRRRFLSVSAEIVTYWILATVAKKIII